MKSQHQVKFKRKRKSRNILNSKAVEHLHKSLDVVNNNVIVGERELKLARALSDTERRVREASLTSLQSWLRANKDELQVRELDRLWKALFYCIWMADRQQVITRTIQNVLGLADIAGWPFLSSAFGCLMREWFGIDRHRVDKYYELANAAVSKSIAMVLEKKTNESFTDNLDMMLGMLQIQVWDRAHKEGQGFTLHVLDMYIDMVLQPLLQRGKSLPGNEVHKVFDKILEAPFQIMSTPQKYSPALVKRITERVLERLVGFIKSESMDLKPKFQRDMLARASKRVMSFAADKATPDSLRKSLYDIRQRMKDEVSDYDESKKQESSNVTDADAKSSATNKETHKV